MPHIALVTYLVRNYDEAIAWFSRALGFRLFEDSVMGSGKRWVVMGPDVEKGARFLLAEAATPDQGSSIGEAAGGRAAFFLHTDNFARDEQRMHAAGVRFLETPRHETYGTVAVFEDLYGNRWDLLEPRTD
jgi:catechol 2,3-dioxygenase-like lactoylglutathione lyase family enzyme